MPYTGTDIFCKLKPLTVGFDSFQLVQNKDDGEREVTFGFVCGHSAD